MKGSDRAGRDPMQREVLHAAWQTERSLEQLGKAVRAIQH
jgi:hypothetical protein